MVMKKDSGWNYREAGVDIKASEELMDDLSQAVASTHDAGVLKGLGDFAGLYRLPADEYREPVLVSGTDGVGTKLLVAQKMDCHTTVGVDLVAMCINDILCQGAKPLFFLDYLATGRLEKGQAAEVLQGIITGCRQAGCVLLGGETAEMPGFYPPGRYDLAGFAVGIVDREKIITGEKIEPGDRLLALSSSGLHSNGFSLVRALLLEEKEYSLHQSLPPLESTLGEELLRPTRIYSPLVMPLLERGIIRGLAHITGGGISGNLKRILPDGCRAKIQKESWPRPPIFSLLQEEGRVKEEEMFSTFNMGLGLIMVCSEKEQEEIREYFSSQEEDLYQLGRIVSGKKGVELV